MKKISKKHKNTINLSRQGNNSLESAKRIEKMQWNKYFNEKTGHGFAAEDANTLNDELRFKQVDKVGTSNAKNGPDRIVNKFTKIQTKYYKSPEKTVDASFDSKTGLFRYKNQLIEVPKGQRLKAIKRLKTKIENGKVPGIKNPQKAKDIIKEGDFTYTQAKNIAKAGNIDSIYFDIKNHIIISRNAFGISFAMQYANARWNGYSQKEAINLAIISGIKNGGFIMLLGVLSQQFLRIGIGRSFAGTSTTYSKHIVSAAYKSPIGKKIIDRFASEILKKTVQGTAAKNAVVKILRSNAVTTVIASTILITPDSYRAIISKKISWKQFGKNFIVTTSGVGGASAGAVAGAALGTLVLPGLGTWIGGAIGGLTGGTLASIGSKKIMDLIAEDDVIFMSELLQKTIARLSHDFMLSQNEIDKYVVSSVAKIIDMKWFYSMYQSGHGKPDFKKAQEEYAYNELEPLFQEILNKREKMVIPVFKTKFEIFKIKIQLFKELFKAKVKKIGRKIIDLNWIHKKRKLFQP